MRTVDSTTSVPSASPEPVAEAVLEAAVAAAPRSFHRRISGKFTQKLGAQQENGRYWGSTWQVMREHYASIAIDQGKAWSLKIELLASASNPRLEAEA